MVKMSESQPITSTSSSSQSPIPIKSTSKVNHSHSNSHQLSLSPSSNPSDLEDHYHQEVDPEEEVFSNPDTDGTGNTSPTPNSPGPSSNSGGGGLGSPLRGSTLFPSNNSHDLNLQKLNILDPYSHPPTTTTDPSTSTPTKPTNPRDGDHSTLKGKPLVTANLTSSTTNAIKSSTTSTSQSPTSPNQIFNPSSSSTNQQPLLPSANELPSDPKEASTLTQLFAHQPDTNPSSTNHSPVQSISLLGGGGGISTPLSLPTTSNGLSNQSPIFSHKNLRSNTNTRPSSPERGNERLGSISPTSIISSNSPSPFRGAGGGQQSTLLSRPTTGNASLISGGGGGGNRAPSIFERDIEHRDASHVLSKSEAVDVAIPNVLDDAAEAIVEDTSDVSMEFLI